MPVQGMARAMVADRVADVALDTQEALATGGELVLDAEPAIDGGLAMDGELATVRERPVVEVELSTSLPKYPL